MQESTTKTELKKPIWLIGNWIRTNNKPEHITYETWKADFTGFGITLRGKDTVSYENIKIIERDNKLFVDVITKGEAKFTSFKIVEVTDTHFQAENPNNEFPKKIKYWLNGEKLNAKVWNDGGFAVDFCFEKK